MIESLVKHVLALPPERLALVNLEDITLCAAWFESWLEENPVAVQPYSELRQTLDSWVSTVADPLDDTEGTRQQPLLRALLNEAVRGNVDILERDELDFLYFCYGLAARTNRKELFQRPIECLEPYISQIHELREGRDTLPGLPTISDRIGIFSSAELKQAEPRDVKIFAGLDITVRGPVFFHRGDMKVIDDIPEGCAVVVEEGSCCVGGRVGGMLAATRSCDVLGNIAGVVVARRGAIRCRNILNQATVVSKEGSVACIAAEDPRLVFAARDISVRTGVLGGHLIARDILIGSEALGSDIQAATYVQAGMFRNGEQRNTTIVLRRGLTCQDYGEVLLLEASRLLTSAIKLSQRRSNVLALQQLTDREADEIAGGLLLFLLGEDDSSERVQGIQDMRRRGSMLDRLLTALRGLIGVAEYRLAASTSAESDFDSGGGAAEEKTIIDQLQRELSHLASEGGLDPGLMKYREEVLHMGRRLSARRLNSEQVMELLRTLFVANQELLEMRQPLEEMVRKQEQNLEKHLERTAILDRARSERNRVQVLEQLIRAGRNRGRDAPKFQRRMNDRYVTLMYRNIQHRLGRVAEYKLVAEELGRKITEVREKLWETYQVSLPDHVLEGWNHEGGQARGHFEEGVWVCAWSYLATQGRAGDHGLIITPDSGEEVAVYRRTAQGRIQIAAPQAH